MALTLQVRLSHGGLTLVLVSLPLPSLPIGDVEREVGRALRRRANPTRDVMFVLQFRGLEVSDETR